MASFELLDDSLWGVLDDLRAQQPEPECVEPCAHTIFPAPKSRYRGGTKYNVRQKLDDDACVCESCGGKHMQVEEGQHVCSDCNVIQGRVIDNGAEYRFFGADDNRSDDPTRCGMPTNNLLPKSSLGSVVGGRWNDNKDHRRIRQFTMWNSMPYWERTLYNIFEKLSSKAVSNGISAKVLDDAKILYKTVSEMKISRADNKEGLVAACLYKACAINKCQRSVKEVARMFNISQPVLTRGNSRFQTLMQINVEAGGPEDFIGRFGTKLNMDYSDVQACKIMTRKVDEMEIVSENAPTSAAAGSLYFYIMMHQLDFTKKQVADVCEVSEVTITKCYKSLMQYKDLIGGASSATPSA